MAKTHQRVFALVFALLFLLSTVAFTGAVLYSLYQQRQDESQLSQIEGNFDDTAPQQGINENVNVEEQVNMLEGTKLEGFDPITGAVTELKGIDLKEGNGEEVKAGATVTAHYTGALADTGVIFQSSHDSGQPIPFGLDQVIAGWTQGVPGMKVGGTRRLIIPANMAYGEAPEGYEYSPGGRPLGPLVFDIELVAVENQ